MKHCWFGLFSFECSIASFAKVVTRDPRYMNSPKLPPLPGIPVETSKGAFHCRGDSEATAIAEAHPSRHETLFFQAADQSLVRDLKDTRLVFFPEPGVNFLVVRIGFVYSNFESELKMQSCFWCHTSVHSTRIWWEFLLQSFHASKTTGGRFGTLAALCRSPSLRAIGAAMPGVSNSV